MMSSIRRAYCISGVFDLRFIGRNYLYWSFLVNKFAESRSLIQPLRQLNWICVLDVPNWSFIVHFKNTWTLEMIGLCCKMRAVSGFDDNCIKGFQRISGCTFKLFLIACIGDSPCGCFEEHFVHLLINWFFIEFKFSFCCTCEIFLWRPWSVLTYFYVLIR